MIDTAKIRRWAGPIYRRTPFADPLRVARRWERQPDAVAGREVCIFVALALEGTVSEQALFHAKSWADNGFDVVLVAVVEDVSSFRAGPELDFCSGILVRGNRGHDFGAWATAIRLLPGLREATRLAIVNDSLFGPFNSFPEFLARARRSTAEVVGTVQSLVEQDHFQSFLLFFNSGALRSAAFWRFWSSVRLARRDFVIRAYELRTKSAFNQAGLTLEALFPVRTDIVHNRTWHEWRQLIEAGFPFIKSDLFKKGKPHEFAGWEAVLSEQGYDPAMVRRALPGTAVAD